LGRWLAKEGTFLEELRPVDAVMAVPLHFWRKHRRGYNQSELLADAFCRETGLLHLKSVLRRKKLTRSQTELGRGERFENVAGAFTIRHPERIRGKSVLLVDDICTTGATLEACARVLREAGARQVNALTVARQI
jgi:ComF family protein